MTDQLQLLSGGARPDDGAEPPPTATRALALRAARKARPVYQPLSGETRRRGLQRIAEARRLLAAVRLGDPASDGSDHTPHAA